MQALIFWERVPPVSPGATICRPRCGLRHSTITACPTNYDIVRGTNMRSKLLICLVSICLLFAACGKGSGNSEEITGPGSGAEIVEITLSGSGMRPDFGVNSYNITFRRDGTAESRESRDGPDMPGKVNKLQRAMITPEQFKALADTVTANGFFAITGPDPAVADASEKIIVVTDKGKQTVSVLGRNNGGLDATVRAIRHLKDQLEWEDAPAK